MHSHIASSISRREMLRRFGGGFGMLGLAGMLSGAARAAQIDRLPGTHFPAKAKRVIFLFMSGGPSQIDTFDPKPMLHKLAGQRPKAADLRTASKTAGLMPSPVKFLRAGQSGVEVSEHLLHTSRHIDEIAVIRSMYTDNPNHDTALCLMNLGVLTPTRPSLGSWLSYGLGTENENLPSFIALCPGKPIVGPKLWGSAFLPAQHQATHINNSVLTPEGMIPHLKNQFLPPGEQRQQLDLARRLNQQHLRLRGDDDALESRIRAMELAYRMQIEALDAFDLSQETAAVEAAYGDSQFAKSVLLARRLSERGVRYVQVFYGNGQPWDTHRNHDAGNERLCKDIDRPVAALLGDLKQSGLLDETLVIWGGEFGRTPTSQDKDGRDHNHYGFTMWLAGGGVKGGLAYGQTDEFGFSAVESKVHIHDLHATVLHLMGLDHERLTYHYSGRDFRLTDVHGHVVHDILV